MWEKADTKLDVDTGSGAEFFPPLIGREKIDIIAIVIVVASASVVAVLTIELRIIPTWMEFLTNSRLLANFIYPLGISVIVIIMGSMFRVFFWLKYKPLSKEDIQKIDWPFISIIMPAYNEQDFVLQAIDSVFKADYPRQKMEVIAVDDGSKDNTYQQLEIAKRRYGDNLRVIRFRHNLGKRRALYSGFKLAKGDIVISIDTDSCIEGEALKNIVIPLIVEPETGAVAGRVAVLNERENIFTKMLAVRYSLAFDFGRAYQSVYGAVLVCPGAFSAFRREALRPVLREWANQVFLRKSCTHGEDRSLTNLILRNGYQTRYQANAVVYTRVPNNLLQINRMEIRWTRSSIRESLVFAKFIFSDAKIKRKYLAFIDFLFLNFLYPVHILIAFLFFYSFFNQPLFIFRQIAFLSLLSFFLSIYYLKTRRALTFIYGIPYGVFSLLCFWWVFPYSLLTLNEPSWLTR